MGSRVEMWVALEAFQPQIVMRTLLEDLASKDQNCYLLWLVVLLLFLGDMGYSVQEEEVRRRTI